MSQIMKKLILAWRCRHHSVGLGADAGSQARRKDARLCLYLFAGTHARNPAGAHGPPCDGFAYNMIKCNPLGSADFVNPNFDVAYFEAWSAVDDRIRNPADRLRAVLQ